jgi:hypothetical protein
MDTLSLRSHAKPYSYVCEYALVWIIHTLTPGSGYCSRTHNSGMTRGEFFLRQESLLVQGKLRSLCTLCIHSPMVRLGKTFRDDRVGCAFFYPLSTLHHPPYLLFSLFTGHYSLHLPYSLCLFSFLLSTLHYPFILLSTVFLYSMVQKIS